MDKLKMQSPNLVDANIDKISALFPNCITEDRDDNGILRRVVDFDLLRQELSASLVEGPQERYTLSWPGKNEAILTANAPIAKTLRPCEEESVDFENTRNIYIEGDNLDALKLLQETYLNKVKMIYIDPPYNTGNDFIYEDDFAEDTETFLQRSNQKDEEGNRLVANTEANGRFHSDWLTMLYPRLKLARNLLREDGVIFISIDDNEVHNLRKVCDEVFGEDNWLGSIIWKNATDNNPTNVAVEHENIQVYARSKFQLESPWKSNLSDIKDVLVAKGKELVERYDDLEELKRAYTQWFRENRGFLEELDRYKYIDKGGIYTGSQSVHNPGREGYRYDVIHPDTGLPCKEPLMGYRFPEKTMKDLLEQGRILFGDDHNKIIELKVYAAEYVEKLSSVFELDGRLGPYDLRQLFPEMKKSFTNPKPVQLLLKYIPFVLKPGDTILDFFSGSATTAHAVMKLNAADDGNRNFILVQIPEPCDEKTDAYKAGYTTIAEIGKERIRRAGKKIKEENGEKAQNLDIGFRVFKVDTSNMKDVYYTPDELKQDNLELFKDHIKPDRRPEDLLFQVFIDWGLDLALPIAKETIDGKTVFFVDTNALVACFDSGITEELVKKLAKHKPLRVVFRDDAFGSDSVKINVEQIFKMLSPGTEVKAI